VGAEVLGAQNHISQIGSSVRPVVATG
jgi:hypothetical protein